MVTEEMKTVLNILREKDPNNLFLKLSEEEQSNHLQPLLGKSSQDLIALLINSEYQMHKKKWENEKLKQQLRESLTQAVELEEKNKELKHQLEIAQLKHKNAELQTQVNCHQNQLAWHEYQQQCWPQYPYYQGQISATTAYDGNPTGPMQGTQSSHHSEQQDPNQQNQTYHPSQP